MVDSLERAFTEASKLPVEEQNWLAEFILEEIAEERGWEELIARSGPALDKLISEAIAEDDAGETLPLDPDSL
jgi:hypothetical protein